MHRSSNAEMSRREFVGIAGALTLGVSAYAQESSAADDPIRVGVVGCGGRGTGAAIDAITASPRARIVALADVFEDRLRKAHSELTKHGERAIVDESRCYIGFDAYQDLVDSEVDLVILATPPHFRPMHFQAAIKAGQHVFMEKPVAVDPAGIRTVLAAADEADRKKICVVAGTQRRHEQCYLEAMKQLDAGAIGKLVSARCYWTMGGLWMIPPRPEWSDMEWQLRNWLYFTWLSGDHIVEQHVHNLDVVNWAVGAHPIKAMGMGGRQVRTHSKYGNVFDHFAVEYEYPDGVHLISMCRQTDGCAAKVEEVFHGSSGKLVTRPGSAGIKDSVGASAWRFKGDNGNPYVQEHIDLFGAIESGEHVNEARQVAESTLTAIMGRMSAYTGQEVTWEQALNSTLDLSPPKYEFGPLPVAEVAMPGQTPLE
jgi:predicted dehydrogenase